MNAIKVSLGDGGENDEKRLIEKNGQDKEMQFEALEKKRPARGEREPRFLHLFIPYSIPVDQPRLDERQAALSLPAGSGTMCAEEFARFVGDFLSGFC